MNSVLRQVKRRIIFLAAACLVLAGVIAYRFYVIQIVRHEELLEKAKRWYTSPGGKVKQRGKFFDADGYLLVGNQPMIYTVCSPYSIVHEPFEHLAKSLKPGVRESIPGLRDRRRLAVATVLAEFFGKSREEYYFELNPFRPVKDRHGQMVLDENGVPKMRKNHFLLLDKAASPEKIRDFKAAMQKADLHLGGFRFDDIFIRVYPKGRMLSNVIGYANVGRDDPAEITGLEHTLRRDLRERDTEQKVERDAAGRPLSYGTVVESEGRNGDDIFLTVKEPIQAILEEELDAAALETPAEFIYAAIIDPRTGNILAISQRPNFDPSDTSTFNDAALSTKISVNAYEPGSVMKPLMVSKALDEGVITPDSIIDCGTARSWYYCGRPLSDPRGYGEMNPAGVLRKSSNIGTAKIALMMGDELVYRTLVDFGFGTKSGLPFSSESRGILPKYPFPDRLTVTRVPIGYSVQVTALQLARAYCALANGGRMPFLRLLDRRRDAVTGEIIRYPQKEAVQVFKNPATAAQISEMLTTVTSTDPTDRGTGWRAAIRGYEVAGKTGTSQRLVTDPETGRRHYAASYRATFCGYVPARRPELVMVITFDGVSGALHGGGNVAAPVFKRTMERVLKLLNIAPDFPEKMADGNSGTH